MANGKPAISVIIASVNGPPMIVECLAALAAQQGSVDAEVIVADASDESTRHLIAARFPWVRLIASADRRSIPELRAQGLRDARGDIIAVIEDHCLAQPDWYQEILRTHQAHPECVAVGGAIENGSCERLVDWAVFFCEYSAFMPPLPRGLATSIAGNNVSYKRQAFRDLAPTDDVLTRGFWEATLHNELRARGERFFVEPSIIVRHKKRFGVGYFVQQRYHYSRFYAGSRLVGASPGVRLFRGAATLGLPPVLFARIAVCVLRKRQNVTRFLLAAPLLVLFTAVWAAGEVVGALLGPADSLRRIE